MPRHATSFHVSRGAKAPPPLREHLERVLDRDTLHTAVTTVIVTTFYLPTQISQIDCWDRPR